MKKWGLIEKLAFGGIRPALVSEAASWYEGIYALGLMLRAVLLAGSLMVASVDGTLNLSKNQMQIECQIPSLSEEHHISRELREISDVLGRSDTDRTREPGTSLHAAEMSRSAARFDVR